MVVRNMDPFILLQQVLPKHGLSRLIGVAAECSTRSGMMAPLARYAIDAFARAYAVNMQEADRVALEDYACFNDFFTRALRAGARPVADAPDVIVSPSDGRLGQHGEIQAGALVQAKGHRYAAADLLASADYARAFAGGYFVTIYLAPKDYHRVHAPETGVLTAARYVPGELFSVNPRTEASVPGLFARNERLVCELQTAFGPLALVMVGALIVAGIRAVWHDGPRPSRSASQPPIQFQRGAELGHFQLGSTVVLCLPPGRYTLADGVAIGQPLQMGQPLLRRHS